MTASAGDFLSIYRFIRRAPRRSRDWKLAMPASTTANLESIRTTLGELAILTTRKTTSVRPSSLRCATRCTSATASS